MSLVKLIPSQESAEALNSYLQQSNLPVRRGFHTTVFYTEETPVFKTLDLEEEIGHLLPISLDPNTYSLQIFGKGELVLRYDNEIIVKISTLLAEEALRQCVLGYSGIRTLEEGVPDSLSPQHLAVLRRHNARRRTSHIYPFNPHITLARNFHGELSALIIPRFPIVMNQINWRENF